MPAPKRLDPTRSLRDLVGWLIRLHRGDWIADRLARQLSEALGRQISGWTISKWETGVEPLTAEAAAALDQVFKTRGLFTFLQVLMAREAKHDQQNTAMTGAAAGTMIAVQSDGQEVVIVATRRDFLNLLKALGLTPPVTVLVGDNPRSHEADNSKVEAIDAGRRAALSGVSGSTIENLRRTVDYYNSTSRTTLPAVLRPELAKVHRYVDGLLDGRLTLKQHRDLVVIAGSIAVIAAWACFDLTDPLAALAWCDDAEERGRDAGDPELAAYPGTIRASIAFYDSRPDDAVRAARAGQALVSVGSVEYVRLAAQEMRALAMAGKGDEAMDAMRRHDAALAALPVDAPAGGVFGINRDFGVRSAKVTTFRLLGDFRHAEELAREELAGHDDRTPTNKAITSLDLALILAGQGQLDEAITVGSQALATPRLASTVVARAHELDQELQRQFPGTIEVRDFHERYVTVRGTVMSKFSPLAIESHGSQPA